MKNDLKYYIFKNTITVNVGSKTITIHKDDPRYEKVLSAINSNELDIIPKIADNDNSEAIRHLLKINTRSRIKE